MWVEKSLIGFIAFYMTLKRQILSMLWSLTISHNYISMENHLVVKPQGNVYVFQGNSRHWGLYL